VRIPFSQLQREVLYRGFVIFTRGDPFRDRIVTVQCRQPAGHYPHASASHSIAPADVSRQEAPLSPFLKQQLQIANIAEWLRYLESAADAEAGFPEHLHRAKYPFALFTVGIPFRNQLDGLRRPFLIALKAQAVCDHLSAPKASFKDARATMADDALLGADLGEPCLENVPHHVWRSQDG
jgi:hypothetical protein